MASKNKRRGNDFEREVVNMAVDRGLDAQRAWGSDGRAMGQHQEVDVMIGDMKMQCKRRKVIARWMLPNNNVHAQVIRQDRGRPYVVMPLDMLFDIFCHMSREQYLDYMATLQEE